MIDVYKIVLKFSCVLVIGTFLSTQSIAQPCWETLANDMTDGTAKGDALKEYITDPMTPANVVDAYSSLLNHKILRRDLATLKEAHKLINRGLLAPNDIQDILKTNELLQDRAEKAAKLLSDINEIADYRNNEGFEQLIRQLKSKKFRASEADGANFVLSAINNNRGLFPIDPPDAVSFESGFTCIKTPNGRISREIDVKVKNGAVDIDKKPADAFYEFKSIKEFPPRHFTEQFIGDLANPNISSLSQIKWVFDCAKIDCNDKVKLKAFKDSILEGLENKSLIPDEDLEVLAAKFGFPNGDRLREELIANFKSIFLFSD